MKPRFIHPRLSHLKHILLHFIINNAFHSFLTDSKFLLYRQTKRLKL